MAVFTRSERAFIVTLGRIIDCNPFLPDRVALERSALGDAYVKRDANWNLEPSIFRRSENVTLIADKAEQLVGAKNVKLSSASRWSHGDKTLYADLIDYVMFSRLVENFSELIDKDWSGAGRIYEQFRKELHVIEPDELQTLGNRRPAHLFAIHFQLYRAFRNIFDHLIGNSSPIIQLRGEVWQSIFTHDVRRYRDHLFERMRDFSTLITGPSGSGKELVARAIGLSSYIPYSEQKKCFALSRDSLFKPINLSALSPTLIESELFGHKRGAYTGAVADRQGWLEACPEFGAVFLDEIGELSEGIQVKLLRVLQERKFQRLGETAEVPFVGKIIAATNRDLGLQMQSSHFRQDLYYRICSDQIRMPSLSQRFKANRGELLHLVQHLTRRIIDVDDTDIVNELIDWIDQRLGPTYPWPGNVRELEQCIRSWLIRKDYQPTQPTRTAGELHDFLQGAELTADELIAKYCTAKYEELGSYQAVGQLLGLDRRTVKARIEQIKS